MNANQKKVYCISKERYQIGYIEFYTTEGFYTDEEIQLRNLKREYYTKNECFHKVKELRKGRTKELKNLINVF